MLSVALGFMVRRKAGAMVTLEERLAQLDLLQGYTGPHAHALSRLHYPACIL